MHVRKRIFTFLFAALVMALLTACGKWDYSREAMKAANDAQGQTLRVEFKVNQTFTNALRAAAEDNIQPDDVDKAMTMDKSIEKLLTSGYRLDVYALRADIDADQAAAQLAGEFVNRLAGCEDEGYIGMVKAENGYFYMAVLTYKHESADNSEDADDGTEEEIPIERDMIAEITAGITEKNPDLDITVQRCSDLDKCLSPHFKERDAYNISTPDVVMWVNNDRVFNMDGSANYGEALTAKNGSANNDDFLTEGGKSNGNDYQTGGWGLKEKLLKTQNWDYKDCKDGSFYYTFGMVCGYREYPEENFKKYAARIIGDALVALENTVKGKDDIPLNVTYTMCVSEMSAYYKAGGEDVPFVFAILKAEYSED